MDACSIGSVESYSSLSSVSVAATEVEWKAATVAVRKAVLYILSHESLVGRRVSAADLITPLNLLGGADGRDGIYQVDEDLIRKSFTQPGKTEYSIAFEEMRNLGLIGEGELDDIDDDYTFLLRVGHRPGSWRKDERVDAVTDFGVHTNWIQAFEDLDKHIEQPMKNPLGNGREFISNANIPQAVKDGLNEFLTQKQNDANRREKKASSSKRKRKDPPKNITPPKEKDDATAAKKAKGGEEDEAKKEDTSSVADLQKEYDELLQKKADIEMKMATVKSSLGKRKREGIVLDASNVRVKADTNSKQSSNTLLYIRGANIGRIELDGSSVIHHDELEKGMIDLPTEIDTDDAAETRSRTNYDPVTQGSSRAWVGRAHELVPKNRKEAIVTDKSIVTKIKELFSGDQSKWSLEAKRIITACCMFGYGCSGEGKIMIMAGIVKALFVEAGVPITDVQIGNGLPSRDTLSNWEYETAADCLLGRCQEMKEDSVTRLAITCDHGHTKNQNHFVKVLGWAGRDENGHWTIKFQCMDIDSAGHTAEEAAIAIKISTELLLEILDDLLEEDVKIAVLTGDSGGGAAVHFLFKELQKLGLMDHALGKMLACDLHNFMKPLEVACVDTWGKQGIGHKTPFQMLWLFVKIMKVVRGEVKREGLNHMWGKVIDKMRRDSKWQSHARANFKVSFDDFVSKLEQLEEEDIDAAVKMATEAPANIQDPVFSRWGTVLAATSVFVENWAVIYFFAMSLKEDKKSGCYVWQMACALLSLMNNADEEPTGEGDSLDNFIESFQTDDDAPAAKLKPGQTPIFLAVLQFLDGFNKAYYEDMYNFLRKEDPHLGKGTWGQMARFGSVRQFIMHDKLQKLEGGKWKQNRHFKKFGDLLEGVGGGENGRDYLKKATDTFFERFRYVFDKHMGKKWRSSSILHYMLAGDPEPAKYFAEWLVFYKEECRNEVVDDESALQQEYHFPPGNMTLGKHHQTNKKEGDIIINIRECMEYITSEADREEIINDEWVLKNWEHIKNLADSPTVVDLWTKEEDGKIDMSTWGCDNFTDLYTSMVTCICIHSNHQQRCENYVQLTRLLSKTGVSQGLRTARAMIVSSIIRPFNTWGLIEKNKMHAAENPPRAAVKRLQGSDKTTLFLTYMANKFIKSDKGRESLANSNGAITLQDIVNRLKNESKKASAKEIKDKLDKFDTTLSKDGGNEVKAEMAGGIYKTGHVAGAVYLRIFVGTNSRYLPGHGLPDKTEMVDVVHAEITKRKIKVAKKLFKTMTLAEKRKLLRQNELQSRIIAEPELKEKEVNCIVPQSDEMKIVMNNVQQQILDKEAAIDRIEDNM